MIERTSLCTLVLLAVVCAAANAQELAMDLHVRSGAAAGSVEVELFSSNPGSTGFIVSLRSGEDERVVPTQQRILTIGELLSGQTYTVSAVGVSPEGAVTETSPEESITVP